VCVLHSRCRCFKFYFILFIFIFLPDILWTSCILADGCISLVLLRVQPVIGIDSTALEVQQVFLVPFSLMPFQSGFRPHLLSMFDGILSGTGMPHSLEMSWLADTRTDLSSGKVPRRTPCRCCGCSISRQSVSGNRSRRWKRRWKR